ncbi:hypothetical protein [Mycobacterium sp.]|uniref:hypothetical protein n=1 Tax=Mycobacterium sp. TaxID=1785 RepID=UPI003C770835
MTATIICMRPPTRHGEGSADVWTSLPSLEAGAAALRECTPQCATGCVGVHYLAYADRLGQAHGICHRGRAVDRRGQ